MNAKEVEELYNMLISDQEDIANLGVSIVENIPYLKEGGVPRDVLNMLVNARNYLMDLYMNSATASFLWPGWRSGTYGHMASIFEFIKIGYNWHDD